MVSEFMALLERGASRGYVALLNPGSFDAQLDAERRARDAALADARPAPEPPAPATSRLVFDIGTSLAEIHLAAVRQTLEAVGGNTSKAARLLGINRRTIYRMLK